MPYIEIILIFKFYSIYLNISTSSSFCQFWIIGGPIQTPALTKRTKKANKANKAD